MLLSNPRVVLVKGRPKTIVGAGKVTADMLCRCLARMCWWVRLAIRCINFEFPSWNLMLSFAVFDVSSRRLKCGFGEDFEQLCFHRLAEAFQAGSGDACGNQANEKHHTLLS